MKPLLPSLKERKRYVAFEVISDAKLGETDIYQFIKESMQAYVGDLGMAQAGLQFVKEKWNASKQRGIARVSHKSTDLLKASFVFVQRVKNKKVIVRSLGVSGILAKAQEKYIAA